MRAPRLARSGVRVSETAVAGAAGAVGWVERALIDMGSADGGPAPIRTAGLKDLVVRSRVGGSYWGARPTWSASVLTVVKADTPRALNDRLTFALDQGAAQKLGVLLPNRLWARSARRAIERRGVQCAIGEIDSWTVLDQVETVVVDGDDDLGFLALLAGRKVCCLSPGYLVGWGLTEDAPFLKERGKREVWQIVQAALIGGTRYFDPFSGRMASCESVVEQLSEWRRFIDQDRDLACCAGIAAWKRRRLRQFLAPQARGVPVLRKAELCVSRAKARGGAVAVWPSRSPAGLDSLAQQANVPLLRVEDGFLRSVGLGSDLLPPYSIVIDRKGVYYDPSRESDLEAILAKAEFPIALRQRARDLIDRLVTQKVTKYNVGGRDYFRPARRKVVLVPGQVEDDQSWLLGGADCSGNLDLLRRVRAHEPDAHVIYKPHPDVEAGNRIGAVADDAGLQYADEIVRDVSIPGLLDCVDAVHVLTSLTGFEALLRGREVVTYGQPFYSGWGLTVDLAPKLARRGRRLTLPELVAGVLILYPRYLDPVTGLLCPPEILVDRLARGRQGAGPWVRSLRRIRRTVERVSKSAAKAPPVSIRSSHA